MKSEKKGFFKDEETLMQQLSDYFARPGCDEVRRVLAEYDRETSSSSSSSSNHWISKLFFSPTRSLLREEEEEQVLQEKETKKRVRSKMKRIISQLPADHSAAEAAYDLLEWWASSREDAWQQVEIGARVAEYMAETPFGRDGAVVAAAILSGAYGRGGLSLDVIKDQVGDDTATLTAALANLEQLSDLQRARWDAEGADRFAVRGAIDDDDRRFDDDHLLYSCRLPSTHANNLRQMLVAVAGDFRALPLLLVRRFVALQDERDAFLLKTKDLKTNQTSSLQQQQQRLSSSLARDALDVHAPLAERFGLYSLKNDLEDVAFERLAPLTRKRIVAALDATREDRVTVLQDVSRTLRRLLTEDDVLMNSVDSLRVSTREKEPYSVWRKQHKLRERCQADGSQFLDASWWAKLRHLDERKDHDDTDDFSFSTDEQSYPRVLYPLDTIALRVVLEPQKSTKTSDADLVAAGEALCYRALDLVHSTWSTLPNRTKDYVAGPKPNGYQSLHTTVLMRLHGASYPFEVQIRTRDMHRVAEFGSAAHVMYSRSDDDDNGVKAQDIMPSLGNEEKESAPAPRSTTQRRRRKRRTFVLDSEGAPLFGVLARSTRLAGRRVALAHSRRARAILEDIASGGLVVEPANFVVQRRRRQIVSAKKVPASQVEAAVKGSPPQKKDATLATIAAGPQRNLGPFPNLLRVRGDADYGSDDSATAGAHFGASLGERLRAERVFVLASGGRVLTVNPRNSAVDVLDALQRDLEADAKRGKTSRVTIRKPLGPLHINGRRHTYISSLEHKLVTGDEVSWQHGPSSEISNT